MSKQELREKIFALAKTTVNLIETEKLYEKSGREFHEYAKFTAVDFHYDIEGTDFQWSVNHFQKSFISRISMILNRIRKTEEYSLLKEFLVNTLKKDEVCIEEISFFIQRLIHKHFENQTISDSDIDLLIQGFLTDINENTGTLEASVELVGLIILEDDIDIAKGVKIRKPRQEDFEFELPVHPMNNRVYFNHPSAFLEISHDTKMQREVQEDIRKAVAILQLFRSGSVQYSSYRMRSTSRLISGNVTVSCGENKHPVYTYVIVKGESESVKHFWDSISSHLPVNLYKFGVLKTDHISIAFDRYKDALIQGGIEERKITNAMMGLEALYFKPSGEIQELDYRLRMRMAKVLGILSHDPVHVKNTVKDAYNIRSIFSHGGRLNAKQQKHYLEKYDGGVNSLTKIILDFLRVSIILSMTIKLEKEKWIDLIDNALIDKDADQKLSTILIPAKQIIQNTNV